jgi:hypothetical protein
VLIPATAVVALLLVPVLARGLGRSRPRLHARWLAVYAGALHVLVIGIATDVPAPAVVALQASSLLLAGVFVVLNRRLVDLPLRAVSARLRTGPAPRLPAPSRQVIIPDQPRGGEERSYAVDIDELRAG